jgi:hypothetical protein
LKVFCIETWESKTEISRDEKCSRHYSSAENNQSDIEVRQMLSCVKREEFSSLEAYAAYTWMILVLRKPLVEHVFYGKWSSRPQGTQLRVPVARVLNWHADSMM